jgi:hypothetical protein
MDRTKNSRRDKGECRSSLDAKGVFMCYEFDEMYWKAREAEEARRKKLADDLNRQERSVPAKPAAPGKGVKEKEPVPA